MKRHDLGREEAAEYIMTRVDMLASGQLPPGTELTPIEVEVHGKKIVILVINQEAWAELQQALDELGCRKIWESVN